MKVYLDNGTFYFLHRDGETPKDEYDQFVRAAGPDWWPIPQDYIPGPHMTFEEQRRCLERTMQVNLAYRHDGYVPVIHISQVIEEYIAAVESSDHLLTKPGVGLGGIVPNLLRAPKAMPYQEILASLRRVRQVFAGKDLHLYGVGGTATLHLAALLGMDSVDSSGWRNRAARGIVQLPGRGDRMVANMGSWRGREPSKDEWDALASCTCPACRRGGLDGLKPAGLMAFVTGPHIILECSLMRRVRYKPAC
jgi:queuine/archaeosine tRNA-ribosyltransferase